MKLPKIVSGGISSAAQKLATREPQRIDIDQLARELELDSEARKLAEQGLVAALIPGEADESAGTALAQMRDVFGDRAHLALTHRLFRRHVCRCADRSTCHRQS